MQFEELVKELMPLWLAPLFVCITSNVIRLAIAWIRDPPNRIERNIEELEKRHENREYIDEDLMKYFNYKE